MRNRYDDPACAGLQRHLRMRMRRFMQDFGDPGVRHRDVLKRVVRADDLPDVLTPPGRRRPGWEGQMRGRPVDLLVANG